jgi:hypothetical protein
MPLGKSIRRFQFLAAGIGVSGIDPFLMNYARAGENASHRLEHFLDKSGVLGRMAGKRTLQEDR